MFRKSPSTSGASSASSSGRVEEQLDTIITHLERLDRRDRVRTFGGFIRSVLGLTPLLLFLGGGLYFYFYSEDVIGKIAEQAAKQTQTLLKSGDSSLLKEFQKMLPK